MKRFGNRHLRNAGAGIAVLAVLAACGPKAQPPRSTPAPLPVVVIPPKPLPPGGASPYFAPPARNQVGLRQTINSGITSAQTTWNLRSAYNVAALNCMQPQHAQIVVNYRAFLKSHARTLTAVNRAVDSEFKAKHGTRFIPPREAYMTQVYNYFALPPTLPAFCDAALLMSAEGTTIKSAELGAFAARTLPQLEHGFLDFFNSYDQYRTDLAAWSARYGPPVMTPAAASPTVTLPPVTLPPLTTPPITLAPATVSPAAATRPAQVPAGTTTTR